MSRNMIFHHQRGLARQVTSSVAHRPNSSSAHSSTMKVLFMLLTCPLTRSDGFSTEPFGEQNNSRNVVFTASKVSAVIFIPFKRKGTCKSLSLGFTQITCDNVFCRVAEWKATFVVTHLCSIPPISVLWCVPIQSPLTTCCSYSILLGHVGKLQTSSLFFTQQVVHPSIF